MKQSLDLVFAVIGLAVGSPVLLILLLMIRCESRGPGFFVQRRVGRGEKVFYCYKLRTMYADTPNVATHLIESSHVTGLGVFLRRSRLDELPQLWNIIRGEMSFVGPRPCLPSQKELIKERRRRRIFDLRPGITGLAQVRGIDMSDPSRLAQHDAEYLSQNSVCLDVQILVRTLVVVGRSNGIRL